MPYDFDTIINRRNTGCMKWDMVADKFGSHDVIPMWVADMDFASPPTVVEALVERARHAVYGYTLREGYYAALQNWLRTRHGWETQTEWMCNAHGVVPSLSMIVDTFTEPGDSVMVQQPVYYPFISVVERNGRKVVNHPLVYNGHRYTMDFEHLEDVLREHAPKLLLLCNPHNPVGRSWTAEELTKLGRLCKAHGVLVVSDEIHADLTLPPHTHTPFATLEDFGAHCITCVAPSKTFNLAGLHTSTVIVENEGLRKRLGEAIQRWSAGSGNAFGIVAAEAAYRTGADWLDALLDYVVENMDHVTEYVQAHIPQLRVVRSEATYLMWIDCSRLGLDDEALRTFFLTQAKVAPSMGTEFGLGGEGMIRLNVACPRETLEQALLQIRQAVDGLNVGLTGGPAT